MDNFIPTSSETDMGVSEALLHAQKIIDAFSKALEDDNCLQAVPIAMFAQADEYESLLTEMSAEMRPADEVDNSTTNVSVGVSSSSAPHSSDTVVDSITSSIKKAMKHECLGCELGEVPEFDMGAVFDDIWKKVQKFINDIKSFFDINRPNFCQFAYMLSFVCIPDLIMILAIILAAILKLMATTILVSFSLMSFIMGILGAIMSAILKYVMALINFGMTPVQCLLDAITSIVDNLPTGHNLKQQLTEEEFALLGDITGAEGDELKEYNDATDKFQKDLKKTRKQMTESVKQSFKHAENVIKTSAAAVHASVEDLLGLKDHLSCEPERSGSNIVEKAEALFELMMVANLVMAMIENKSKASALDELCREQDDDYNSVQRNTEPFTTDDVASVIASAFNSTATIVESDDEDVAILLTPNEDPSNSPRLSFFECSMNEFIKNAHMDPVIDNAVQVAEEFLKGEGLNPRAIKHTRTNVDDLSITKDQQVLVFGQNEESVHAEISKVIEEVLTFNTGNDDIAFQRAVSSKLTSDTLPEEYQEIKEASTITSNPSSEAKVRLAEDPIDLTVTGFSGNITNKPIQLNCGTIDNLRDTLDLLKE